VGRTDTQITSHLDRLQSVERGIAALKSSGAAKEELSKVRGEMKKVYVSRRSTLLPLCLLCLCRLIRAAFKSLDTDNADSTRTDCTSSSSI
jgi:hypothetical protein